MTTSGQAWTLIARFSNNDAKHWMEDSGEWWHDKSVGVGDIADPSVNADMVSPPFWLVRGREFKVTRSNDPEHTVLLQTTGDCLGGKTFRGKSPVMATLEMVQFGQAMTAREIVLFNMEVSFKQPMDSDKLHAMDQFKAQHKSASGVTGALVMERC